MTLPNVPDLSQLSRPSSTPMLYVNLDGPVRVPLSEHDPLNITDVNVYPEAAEALARWKRGGGRVIGLSNYGGVALGVYDVRTAIQTMEITANLCARNFDQIAFCFHHPDADMSEMARCYCRMPRPAQAIIQTEAMRSKHRNENYFAHDSLFVGVTDEDRRCADMLGVDFQHAEEWWATVTT